MDESQIKELKSIRKFEEKKYWDKIPCDRIAYIVHKELGFDIQMGYFEIPSNINVPKKNRKEVHVWDYCKESKEKVDLSADQFPGINEPILIIPDGSPESSRYSIDNRLDLRLFRKIAFPWCYRDYTDFLKYKKDGFLSRPLGIIEFLRQVGTD